MKKFAVCLMLLSVSLLQVSIVPLSHAGGVGYLSGTQGLQPEFNSLKWRGDWWSATEAGSPIHETVGSSSQSFGWSMDFDPDQASEGMPDFCASEQAITLDPVAPLVTSWSVPSGTETLANGTIMSVTKQFDLYRYTCDWAMNVWLSGSEWESDGKYAVDSPFGTHYLYFTPNYASAELWIKVAPTEFVYFTENPSHVYFAPAYIALKEPVTWAGIDNNGQKTVNDADVAKVEDIIPKSSGEALGFYYNRGGTGTFSEATIRQYEGLTLDPSLFQNAYWVRINLVQFKPLSWTNNVFWHAWKYPSAYLHFQVYIYVVGEWKVYFKTGDIPVLTPHTPIMQTSNPWDNFWGGVANWVSNPLSQLWAMLFVAVAVVVVVSVVSPGVWTVLASRKSSKEKG